MSFVNDVGLFTMFVFIMRLFKRAVRWVGEG